MMSTSLSGVSSPRANEPNSHAFKTGCVLKYSAMVVLMSCVLIVENPTVSNAKVVIIFKLSKKIAKKDKCT